MASLQAAVAGLLMLVVPALAIWMATPRISVPWPESVRLAVNVWLLGHGTPLILADGRIDVVPLGLLLPLLWLSWSGGVRVVQSVEQRHSDGFVRGLVAPGVIYAAAYATIAIVMAAFCGDATVRASLGAVALAAALVALAGLLIAAFPQLRAMLPGGERLELVVRGAGVALLGWFGLALVVLVSGAAWGAGRMVEVQQALHPGGLGHVLLVLLQLVLVPTAWVWSASYVTGIGFSVGQGTAVSPFGTELAPLPALPLLGALPQTGSHPVQAVLLPALVVLAGGIAGYWVRQRRGERRGVELVGDAVMIAALATGAGVVLALLSSGAAGPGRMGDLGPAVGWLALVAGGQLLLGSLIGTFAGPSIAAGRPMTFVVAQFGRAREAGGNRLRRAAEGAGGVAGSGFNAASEKAQRLGAASAGKARSAAGRARGAAGSARRRAGTRFRRGPSA